MAESTQYFVSSNQSSSIGLSGTYTFHNGVVLVPSGATVPAPTADAQIYWVPPSGKLCIASGTAWVTFTLS